MKEFQKKQRLKRAIYSLPAIIILAIIAAFLVKGAVRVSWKEQESASRLTSLSLRVSELKLRKQSLKENIARLETSEGLDDEIKTKFNIVPKGENVAIIIDEQNGATSTDVLVKPWYKRFWDAIMKK